MTLQSSMRTANSDHLPRKPLVTVSSGFARPGKTTLLNHLLSNREKRLVAVIVNDRREVGRLPHERRFGYPAIDKFARSEFGGMEARRMKHKNACDRSAGIAGPLPTDAAFTFRGEDGASLSAMARSATLVTVADVGSEVWRACEDRFPAWPQDEADA
ncbi:hypothetical protein EVC37_05140 [Methylocaldum sp. BRCS4]|nr:hypothetical protein [Methylocaldum sp. BRCS4]